MLISSEYAELNRRMHERPEYGISGTKYVEVVRQMAKAYNTASILDYGCGKRTMEQGLGFPIANYDPAISGLEARPEPADIVVCTDVLEHIEPEFVSEVLDDIQRCTRRALLATVAVVPAAKLLPDGTNPHRSIHPWEWWFRQLDWRWRMTNFADHKSMFLFIGEPRIGAAYGAEDLRRSA